MTFSFESYNVFDSVIFVFFFFKLAELATYD